MGEWAIYVTTLVRRLLTVAARSAEAARGRVLAGLVPATEAAWEDLAWYYGSEEALGDWTWGGLPWNDAYNKATVLDTVVNVRPEDADLPGSGRTWLVEHRTIISRIAFAEVTTRKAAVRAAEALLADLPDLGAWRFEPRNYSIEAWAVPRPTLERVRKGGRAWTPSTT